MYTTTNNTSSTASSAGIRAYLLHADPTLSPAAYSKLFWTDAFATPLLALQGLSVVSMKLMDLYLVRNGPQWEMPRDGVRNVNVAVRGGGGYMVGLGAKEKEGSEPETVVRDEEWVGNAGEKKMVGGVDASLHA